MRRLYTILSFVLLFCAYIDSHTAQKYTPPLAWSALAEGAMLNRYDLTHLFVKDCIRDYHQNNAIPSIKNHTTIRVATYNIHLWMPAGNALDDGFDYSQNENFNAIIEVIKKINAHIVVLQEMVIFDWPMIKEVFEGMGYECSRDAFVQNGVYCNYPFGTIILSKVRHTKPYMCKTYHAQTNPLHKVVKGDEQFQGGFIKTLVQLSNAQELVIYGTHLDVHDKTGTVRYRQVQELVQEANKDVFPCVIAGDFNAVRKEDYHCEINGISVWNLLNADRRKRACGDICTAALDLFAQNGFCDCFSKTQCQTPYYSVWNGTRVDFLWLNKEWNLPVKGCYVYYSSVSDHLPIIMDIDTNNTSYALYA